MFLRTLDFAFLLLYNNEMYGSLVVRSPASSPSPFRQYTRRVGMAGDLCYRRRRPDSQLHAAPLYKVVLNVEARLQEVFTTLPSPQVAQ